jgi:hypothetical protein
MKKFFALGVMIFAMALSSKGQINNTPYLKGYLVTTSGDTLHGYIKQGNQQLKYRPTPDGKKEIFDYSEIPAYKYGREEYQYIEGYVYKHEIKGPVNLFSCEIQTYTPGAFGNSYYGSQKIYAVKRDNEEKLTPLFERGFFFGSKKGRKLAMAYFSDAPEIAEKIKEKKYTLNNVEKLINDYNLFVRMERWKSKHNDQQN